MARARLGGWGFRLLERLELIVTMLPPPPPFGDRCSRVASKLQKLGG